MENSLKDSPTEQFSKATEQLLQTYQESLTVPEEPEGGVNTIQVDEVASKVAAFYEKLRMIIDWKDEHLIRRTAIERSLKRRFISEIGFTFASVPKIEELAESLVLELIRAGHFPNATIPRYKLEDVAKVLSKYLYILDNTHLDDENSAGGTKRRVNFYNWLLEIAACEIEEALEPPVVKNALIDYMTVQLVKNLRVDPSLKISEEEKETYTYIAVHRSLFRLDAPIISYHLFKRRYTDWANLSEEQLEEVTGSILSIWGEMGVTLEYPLSHEFFKYCERYDALYLLMGDLLDLFEENPAELEEKLVDPPVFKALVEKVYNARLSTLRARLSRLACYSTLSIFVAGGVSLFLVEVPLARLFAGRFSPLALAVDLLVPTAWMYFLVATVRPPAKDNLERVIEGMGRIVHSDSGWGIYEVQPKKRRSFVLNFMIMLFYFLGWCVSLSSVAAVFYFTRVPLPSVVLDTLNVAVITFAGMQIRQRAMEISVGEERNRLMGILFDTFSLPVAKFGKWLSTKWKEYNIVAVFFTALIDMPFLAFIELIEGWSIFLKEKKSGMYS